MTADTPDAVPARLAVRGEKNSIARIDVETVRAAAGDDGARIVGLDVDGDGAIGFTSAGTLVYRPAHGFTGAETARVDLVGADGVVRTVAIDIAVAPTVAAGSWGEGEHYVLARDADGWSLPEPGERHRVVHVSVDGDPAADGLTPETAVDTNGLTALMETLYVNGRNSKNGAEDVSWHVLFRRGDDFGDFALPHVNGEDPLHPFVIGAYGAGARPVFGADMQFWRTSENVLVRDIEFAYAGPDPDYTLYGIDVLGEGHRNLMFENIVARPLNASVRLQSDSEDITVYRTSILDAHRPTPAGGDADWSNASNNRQQGLYATKVDGLLIEQSLALDNGWREGYRFDETGPFQPPSKFSHNFYLNFDMTNLTFRENISGNAASNGAQIRSGGFVDSPLLYTNNVGFNAFSGLPAEDGYTNDRGVVIDTVVTEPSNKDSATIGARGWGAQLRGDGLVVDTIFAQDGDARDEARTGVSRAVAVWTDYGVSYDLDAVTVFNWGVDDDILPHAGADRSAMEATTLDAFAKATLGPGADVEALEALWRARDRDTWNDAPDAADATAFFRDGFGYVPSEASLNRDVTFESDPRAEGFRWDNRLNWTDDRGPISGDTVRIDGHHVTYGGESLALAGLDLGDGGSLRVTQGLLAVSESKGLTVGALGGRVLVDNAGQFLFDDFVGPNLLTLSVDGGRAANVGGFRGLTSIAVTDGQFIMGADGGNFRLEDGSSITIVGDDAKIGYDALGGDATFRLTGGTLRYVFDADGVSPIETFRSGRHGVAEAGIDIQTLLMRGTIELDFTALAAPAHGDSFRLIDGASLAFDSAAVALSSIGLAEDMTATLRTDVDNGDLHVDLLRIGAPPPPPPANPPPANPTPADPPPADPTPLPPPPADAPQQEEPLSDTIVFPAPAPFSGDTAVALDGGRWNEGALWAGGAAPAEGDDARIDGHAVVFDGGVTNLHGMTMTGGAALTVTDGVLQVGTRKAFIVGDGGADILVEDGAFIFDEIVGGGPASLQVTGGLAINNGGFRGAGTFAVSGDGRFVIGPDGGNFRIGTDARMTIEGSAAKVGFDAPSGVSTLRLTGGELAFSFDQAGVSALSAFQSGRYGDAAADITVDVRLLRGALSVDFSAFRDAQAGDSFLLIDADMLPVSQQDVAFEATGLEPGLQAALRVDAEQADLYVEVIASDAPLAFDWL